jgi:glutamine amidotransferase
MCPYNWIFSSAVPLIDFIYLPLSEGPHNSGWGVAWEENDCWQIHKEGKYDVEEYNLNFLKNVNSKNLLIHLRKASVGQETSKNSHPFLYKGFAFEHNGTLNRESLLKHLSHKKRKMLTSKTDSEVLFFLIMELHEETKDIKTAISEALKIARQYEYTSFNFILSDEDNTYAYREISPDFQIDLNYYSLYYLKRKNEIVISSDKLDKQKWKLIKPGELFILNKNLKLSKQKLTIKNKLSH